MSMKPDCKKELTKESLKLQLLGQNLMKQTTRLFNLKIKIIRLKKLFNKLFFYHFELKRKNKILSEINILVSKNTVHTIKK